MQLLINAFSLSTAQVIARTSNFVLVLFITRYFGPEMYGNYLTIGSLQMVFAVIADFGFSNLLIRNVARNNDLARQYAATSLFLRLFFSLVAFTGLLATGYLLRYPSDMMFLLFLSGLSIPFASLTGILSSVLAAHEKMHISSAWDVLTRIVSTIVNIGLLFAGYGLKAVFLSNLIVSASAFILLMRFMSTRELEGMQWREMDTRLHSLKEMVLRAFPFFVVAVLGILYIRTEIVILSKCAGVEEVGWFGAALKPLEAAFVIPVSVFAAFFPRVSEFFYKNSQQEIIGYYDKALRFMVTLATPLTIIFFACPEGVVLFLYGQALMPAAQAMPILSCVLLISFVNSPVGNLVFASDHASKALPFLVLGAAVRLTLSIYLIIKMGYLGACFSLVISETIHFFINYYLIKMLNIAKITPCFYMKILWPPFVSGLIMLFYLRWAGFLGLPALLTTGILIYGILMLVFISCARSFKRR